MQSMDEPRHVNCATRNGDSATELKWDVLCHGNYGRWIQEARQLLGGCVGN
jgi:hypothetical protein